ncbi:MAG: carboxynorspermidine decarboxylase [Rhodobacteraceae bacterium]|nr:MAG: carboxynorspermidine decarboxylase [Paracoccaceae bacterium]TVS02285.1 MAG: carboxynorspermidine decarboxylase [Paracoccaceae bacterium]
MAMQTHAGDPGAFARFDLSRVPSPCFVVDEARLEANLKSLADIQERSGATVLCALKAFSMWELAPLVSRYLSGVCASGLWEARLGHEHYGGIIETFSAGYKPDEMSEIIRLSDHIVFNTPAAKDRFLPMIRECGKEVHVGLRFNPGLPMGEDTKYDPAAPGSRLGTPLEQIDATALEGVDGLHMHTLCEQDLGPLLAIWNHIAPRIRELAHDLQWINFGGGHHITRADYDREGLIDFLNRVTAETGLHCYLEPGEAVALDAGILVGEVLDVVENDGPNAILDISATCHMPDVIEAPYRPALLGEGGAVQVRLGGPSCLAGDVIGRYAFTQTPEIGSRVAFLDQAHYSMVKTTTFNGVRLPALAVWNSDTDALRVIRQFDYQDFKGRLS